VSYKKKNSSVVHFFDGISNKSKSVRLYYDKTAKNNTKDITKEYISFLPNLIQSIDGYLIRNITNLVYKKNKYIIEPLHDSIRFHPNMILNVHKSIVSAYYAFP